MVFASAKLPDRFSGFFFCKMQQIMLLPLVSLPNSNRDTEKHRWEGEKRNGMFGWCCSIILLQWNLSGKQKRKKPAGSQSVKQIESRFTRTTFHQPWNLFKSLFIPLRAAKALGVIKQTTMQPGKQYLLHLTLCIVFSFYSYATRNKLMLTVIQSLFRNSKFRKDSHTAEK